MHILFSRKTTIGFTLLVGLLLSLTLSGVTPLAVHATANTATIRLSTVTGPPTTKVTVKGTGFGSSETVIATFDINTVLGTTTTDSMGNFSLGITIPASALPGKHSIQATGQSSGLTASHTFLANTNWQQFGYDPAQSRTNPYENVITSTNVSNLTLDWSYPTVNGITSSPAMVNGVVYIGAYATMWAFNAKTGRELWNYRTNNSISSPAVVNNVVYIGSAGTVYALNAKTGANLWIYTKGTGWFSSPTVVNGVVYVGSTDGNVYTLNAKTGANLWIYNTEGEIYTSSLPAVANGVVYVGAGFSVFALKAGTGAKLWSFNTGGTIGSSPAVVNGVVYIGGGEAKVYAINAKTGIPVWIDYSGCNDAGFSAPAVANGMVYIDDACGTMYAFNVKTGTIVWSFNAGEISDSSPAVANGVVYFGSMYHIIYGLDASTGAMLWSYTTGGYIQSSPAVANGVVYVGSNDDYIYAFHLPGM